MISWNPSLSIGVPEIDAQHQALFEKQRRLGALLPHWESEGASTALLLALVGFLDLWLRDHVTSSDQRIGDYLRARAHS